LVAVAANWVVLCQATQFAMAATNHSALSLDEMKSGEMSDVSTPYECFVCETGTWEAASTMSECCGWLAVPLQTWMALHHSAIFKNSILPIMTSLILVHAVYWNTYRFSTLKGLHAM